MTTPKPGKIRIQEQPSGQKIVLRVGKASLTFDKAAATVSSYKVGGKEYIQDGFGFRPNFWRGPTDNDYGNKLNVRAERWKTLSYAPQVRCASAPRWARSPSRRSSPRRSWTAPAPASIRTRIPKR